MNDQNPTMQNVNIPVQQNNIFSKFLETKPIFAQRNVLSISFTPETIPHREQQIDALSKILAPALKGARPSNVFIYGRTGTGKTCVAKYVCEQLEKISAASGSKVKVVYINCKMRHGADTEYRLISQIVKAFDVEVPFTGIPTQKVYQIFNDVIDKDEHILILILDEIDALVQRTGDEILYNITRINQDLKKAKVSIIGITNDLNLIAKLDPRVKSSLSEEELVFPPYNAVELRDILWHRAKVAFNEDVIEEGVIEKCAAIAAQENGDARRALDLLRVAGEIAERQGDSKVRIEHVEAAESKIDTDNVIEVVKFQPRQSQAVLYAICKLARENPQKALGNVSSNEIYTTDVMDQYVKICRMHRLKQLTMRRVSDLIAELDLFGIITTKVISKGRYGRTRTIKLNVSDQVYEKIYKLLSEIFSGV